GPPGHPRVDDPIRLESGRSVTRTWRLSRLIQPCGPTLLPTLLPMCALPPAAKGEPFYPSYEGALALVLSRCTRSVGGCQMQAEAPEGASFPPTAEAHGLPLVNGRLS